MKRKHILWLWLSLLLIPSLTIAGSPSFTGYNTDVEPGIQVVDNPNGSATVKGSFKLYNNTSPSNALGASAFTVKVDGNPVQATVVPPNQQNSQKMADIVFCMDISGSMSGEITAVKNNTQSFVNQLSSKNFDVRLGLITFGQSGSPQLRKRNNGNFYSNSQNFINEFSGLSASGGFEEWFDCLAYASQYPYRSGAERITILITDENGNSSKYNINTALPIVKNNASKVYGISYTNLSNVVKAVNETGGTLFNIRDNFNNILNSIANSIINTYSVSLLTNVGPGQHFLHVTPSTNDPVGEDKEPFKIGANPVVSLPQSTSDLINNGVVPGAVSLNIEAQVTDPDGSISQVNILWDDPSNNGTNAMSALGNNIYGHTYSGTLNQNQCFAFAVQALDNEGRNTTVPANSGNTPGGKWRICASDTPPVIGTISPDNYDYQQDVNVSVDISDDNGSASLAVTLKYREIGDATWQNTPMSESGGTFTATVPAAVAGFKGLQLDVVAQDASSNVSNQLKTLTVNAIPVTIVDVTKHTDTTDVGPFSVHAIVVGLDLSNGGQVELVANGATISMTQSVTGTNAQMLTNSNIYVAKIPAANPGDKVCYSVKASNPTANAQSTETCFEVLQPIAPLAVTPASSIMAVGDSPVEFMVTGGYGNYEWSALNGTLSTTLGDKISYTPTLTGLDKVSVKDQKGFTATVILKVLPALTIDPPVDGQKFTPSTNISLNAIGGEEPYEWQVDGATFQASGNNNENVEISLGANPATIKVTVTDAAARTKTVSFTNNGQLKISPNGPNVTVEPNSETEFTVSGGDGSYQWTTIGGDVDNPTANKVKYQAPSVPGTYHLLVKDGSGASASLILNSGTPLIVTPHCARIQRNEVAEFEVVSGTAPYNWEANFGSLSSTSGNKVTFTPESNIGLYEVTVHDGSGAIAKLCVQVAEGIVVTPSTISVDVNSTTALTATGGNGNYTWSATRGTLSPNTGGNVTYTAPNSIGQDTITIRDTAGNEATVSVQVIDTKGANSLSVTPSVAAVQVGQTKTFTAKGGSGNYSWTAKNGTVSPNTGASVTYTAPNLAGTDEVKVADDKGNTATVNVKVLSPVNPLSITPKQATVNPGDTQTFTIANNIGGISWSASGGSIDNNGTFTAPKSGGSYTITAIDYKSGRSIEATVIVGSKLIVTPTEAQVSTGGSSSFSVAGGESPYTWNVVGEGFLDSNTGDNVRFTAGNSADEVSLIVSDNQGVTSEVKIKVSGTMVITPEKAILSPNGTKQFTVFGGSGTIDWAATQGKIDDKGNYTAPSGLGTYVVTAKDDNGNQASATVEVKNIPVITPEFAWLDQGGTVIFDVVGGTAPYQWHTTAGQVTTTGNRVTYTAPQVSETVTVTVIDNQGKKDEATVYVDIPLRATKQEIYLKPGETRRVAVTGGIPAFEWQAGKGEMKTVRTEDAGYNYYTAPNVMGEDVINIRDRKNKTVEVQVYVTQPLQATPSVRYMKRNETTTFRVMGGVGPYTAASTKGTINATSETGEFTFSSAQMNADENVTITFSDMSGQSVIASVFVEVKLKASPKTIYLDRNTNTTFNVIGGTGGYFAEAASGQAEIDKDTGKGTYTSPGRYGSYDIKVTDSSDQSVVITAVVERSKPTISPSIITMSPGETRTLMVNRGAAPYEWTFNGNPIREGEDDDYITNEIVSITAPETAGTYEVVVEDVNGQLAKATVTVFQPLMISPISHPVYKGESVAVRFTQLGGAGKCDWALADLQEIDKGDNYIVVRPRTDVEIGTEYRVICRDQNGDSTQSIIIVGSLPGDLNGDGIISDEEAQIAIERYFDGQPLNGVTIDKRQLYMHVEANIIVNQVGVQQ